MPERAEIPSPLGGAAVGVLGGQFFEGSLAGFDLSAITCKSVSHFIICLHEYIEVLKDRTFI